MSLYTTESARPLGTGRHGRAPARKAAIFERLAAAERHGRDHRHGERTVARPEPPDQGGPHESH